jgi:hypothetical protein
MKTNQNRSIVIRCMYSGFFSGCALLQGCNALKGDNNREPIKGLDTRLMRAEGYSFDEKGAQRVIPAGDGRPSIVMEIRHGKRQFERVPLAAEKPTYIQDIVDDAKLVDKLGNIQVTILRPTGPTSPPIRMPADFDADTKRIVVGQNYALQANDQLIVTKDTRSWLDNLSILGGSPRR